MSLLLDTNVCIDVLRGNPGVIARFQEHSPHELILSVVTEFELLQGTGRAPVTYRAAEWRKVNAFLAQFKMIPFDSQCARLAAEINAGLLNAGTPVGVLDVYIAATALRLGVPVVTSNSRDFSRIKDLAVIDWRNAGDH